MRPEVEGVCPECQRKVEEDLARRILQFREEVESPIWRGFLKALVVQMVCPGIDPRDVDTADLPTSRR